MPIYAYRCDACGLAKDVLQKLSDPQLTDCPACGQPTFKKQLTAAGFQLKGTGWYATDFKSGKQTPAASDAGDKTETTNPTSSETKTADASTSTADSSKPATSSDKPAASPASKPAASGSTPAGN